MSEFFVGLLFGFLLGFASGTIIVGTARICEWIKIRNQRKEAIRIQEQKQSKDKKGAKKK